MFFPCQFFFKKPLSPSNPPLAGAHKTRTIEFLKAMKNDDSGHNEQEYHVTTKGKISLSFEQFIAHLKNFFLCKNLGLFCPFKNLSSFAYYWHPRAPIFTYLFFVVFYSSKDISCIFYLISQLTAE